ncbi:hypothetical protein F5Y05DRAFT_35581 [Hypoxylon sp. FL0543]|nr:hypothetical protein F5Y05DRAFT_35581 [Hypoxylon sp. FL0543]
MVSSTSTLNIHFRPNSIPLRSFPWQFFAFCFLGLLTATLGGKPVDEVRRRHLANVELLARGQITLDLFPPLSYLFAMAVPESALRPATIAARLISVSMILRQTPNGSCRWLVSTILCVALPFILEPWQGLKDMNAGEETHSLNSSAAVAACLLLLSLSNFRSRSGARLTGARQVSVILAAMLGCNAADWILTYAIITTRDIYALSSPKICSSWRQLARRVAFAVFRAIALPLVMLVAVYGLLSPFSETAGGRNHNLHFLDASTRISLSPQQPIDLKALGLEQHARHIPDHALIPFLPLSLYVPNAGFLWGSADNDTVSSHMEETGALPMAVYFSDPIGRRYPWAFEQPDAPGDEGLSKEQRHFVQSHLWPKALVYLRSRIDHSYLGTAPFLDIEDGEMEPFRRFPLGLHAERSAATVWVLDYDPAADTGFRLYSPHRDCHLATTFRSNVLDQDTKSHDDLVHPETTGTIEASCTRLVSKSASTFWIIEGRLHHPRTLESVVWRARLPPTLRTLAETFQRGCRILRAHVSLYRWQNRYGHHLELVPSPLAFSRLQKGWETWTERLIMLLFLGIHSLFLLARQRTGRSLPGGHDSFIPALICWAHVLVYAFLGFARPYGYDVELAFALYGLRVMLR